MPLRGRAVTDIEELVRDALAATPMASPTTDPLAALDRRVRRARRRLAAGAGVVAAVIVAAVVVPVAFLGGNGSPKSVGVVRHPTPKPGTPAGTTTLWQDGAIWVSDADGQQWLLFTQGGDYFVGP